MNMIAEALLGPIIRCWRTIKSIHIHRWTESHESIEMKEITQLILQRKLSMRDAHFTMKFRRCHCGKKQMLGWTGKWRDAIQTKQEKREEKLRKIGI